MTTARKALAEFLGTCGLLIVIVGSGIMGESLAQGNAAVALLANSLATGCGLYVLIHIFSAFSGAHFNPIVSLFGFFQRTLSFRDLGIYSAAQFAGAMAGVWLTHFMFGQDILQTSTHNRAELRFFFSETVATFGLLMTICFISRKRPERTPSCVALYITAAYWCTSSTSFANPAVTVARSFTNTFSGIERAGVLGFILAQVIGFALISAVASFMLPKKDFTA